MTDNNKIKFRGKIISLAEAQQIVENNISKLRIVESEDSNKEGSLVDRIEAHQKKEINPALVSEVEVNKVKSRLDQVEREIELKKLLGEKKEKPQPRQLIKQIQKWQNR